ncbi:MAG: OB-fold domain-containing protein [Acidobacteriota bacterium]|nr:OB-fold domain-containing protein [Acidobacteriota bacterium]
MFERFGTVGFTRHTRVGPFVERLEAGELTASRCAGCGVVALPPRADCPACLGGEFTLEAVDPVGRLVSYTTIHALPAGFEHGGPFTLALVEMSGGGRLLAPVGPCFARCPPVMGERVRIVIRSRGEGDERRILLFVERAEGADAGRGTATRGEER